MQVPMRFVEEVPRTVYEDVVTEVERKICDDKVLCIDQIAWDVLEPVQLQERQMLERVERTIMQPVVHKVPKVVVDLVERVVMEPGPIMPMAPMPGPSSSHVILVVTIERTESASGDAKMDPAIGVKYAGGQAHSSTKVNGGASCTWNETLDPLTFHPSQPMAISIVDIDTGGSLDIPGAVPCFVPEELPGCNGGAPGSSWAGSMDIHKQGHFHPRGKLHFRIEFRGMAGPPAKPVPPPVAKWSGTTFRCQILNLVQTPNAAQLKDPVVTFFYAGHIGRTSVRQGQGWNANFNETILDLFGKQADHPVAFGEGFRLGIQDASIQPPPSHCGKPIAKSNPMRIEQLQMMGAQWQGAVDLFKDKKSKEVLGQVVIRLDFTQRYVPPAPGSGLPSGVVPGGMMQTGMVPRKIVEEVQRTVMEEVVTMEPCIEVVTIYKPQTVQMPRTICEQRQRYESSHENPQRPMIPVTPMVSAPQMPVPSLVPGVSLLTPFDSMALSPGLAMNPSGSVGIMPLPSRGLAPQSLLGSVGVMPLVPPSPLLSNRFFP